MAYQNGNKPIVTNGLVYALDFGNTKSYNAGSNRAVSLAYDPTVTIVTGSTLYSTNTPTGVPYSNGLISLSGSQWIARTSSFSSLDPNRTFTISYVIRPKALISGSILGQQTTTSNFNTEISPTSSTVGFYYENQSYSRTYTGLTTSSFQYVVYRYNSGSVDFFINGIPVTASAANNPIPNFQGLNNLFIGAQAGLTRFANSSLYNFLLYNRALTADEIYLNYSVFAGRFGMSVVPKPYSIDENLYQFIQTTGITDSNTQTALATFVSGLKVNGLWNKLLAIYPFVGSTTASQAVNLKEPGIYRAGYTGSWALSASGSTGNSTASLSISEVAPTTLYPGYNSGSAHLTYLSYDLPQSSSYLMGAVSYTSGSGGQIIITGSRTYHVFTSSATFSAIAPGAVEVFMVGGGGGAGGATPSNNGIGGGGGAGGVVYKNNLYITASNYIVTVGTGGASPVAAANGFNGQNTLFGPLVAFGGGGGGIYGDGAGSSGGSGGGGGAGFANTTYIQGGDGTVGQGNDGGRADLRTGGPTVAGGGGGASEPGGFGNNTTTIAGNGGSGSYFPQYTILTAGSGSPAGWYAGGGGGGAYSGTGGTGGPGGGANGNVGAAAASGSPNTGGGGGGNGYTAVGGPGGSGIVIISYPTVATSSFALKITETSLTGSLNSPESSAITASGNIGLVTVSRKQAGILSLHKNNISASFGTAGEFLPFPNLYLNAANNAGTASGITPSTISYASIGTGLTTSEVATYHNLVSQLQANLKRQNTLLDNYSGAAAAYSLRRIGPSGYFGPAIRVRRDSDNTLRDIGFTSDGQLDTVGLLDFVGVTGSGFVNTWYDQSGNNNNATQGTTGSQPFIVASGSITTINSKPSLLYSVSGFSSLNLTTRLTDVRSVFWATTPKRSIITTPSDPAAPFLLGDSSTYDFHSGLTSYFGSNASINVTSAPFYVNSELTSSTVSRPTASFDSFRLLSIHTAAGATVGSITQDRNGGFGGRSLIGNLSELLLFSSSQSTTRTAIESNINSNYKIFGSATASFDPDYSAFITATGITQPTQSAALETLVSDLKSYGLWSKMKAIYPMVTDKYNLYSNTENLSTGWLTTNSSVTASNVAGPFTSSLVANRLNDSISSPVTLTVTPDGISAYIIDGSTNPTLSLEKGRTYNFNISATGHPFYIMTGSGARTVDGQYNTGVTGQGTENGTLTFTVPNNAPSALAYICGNHTPMAGTISIIENTDQHYIYQTVTLTSGSAYVMSTYARWNGRDYIVLNPDGNSKTWFDIRNGFVSSSLGTVATASITRVSGTSANPSGSWYRCSMVFTSSVSTPYNTSIQLAETNGSLTYGSLTGLSGSFLWGAQFEPGDFISPYLSNTTNNAYTTSSVLDQFKFNLKNPVDTNAAFRITFSGSWTPAYSGLKGDGATGTYAATKVNSTTRDLAMNSGSFSVYSRSNTVGSFGLYGNSNVTNTRFYWDGSNFKAEYGGPYLGVGTTDSYPGNIRGLLTVNRNLNRTTGFVRTQKYIDYTYGNSDGTVVSNDIAVGFGGFAFSSYYNGTEYQLSTGGIGRNAWEHAFATFAGVPLSDYESKALYWIVQKYQTTLGRQVY